ncbi:hypothetical protein HGB47_16530 [Leptospira yasudae]|uniref:hypothetical protein n=1 Tax=Leptospira yasudae TaxID=2202201 RepID=UPI001C4F535C|nr:hypothetical protein [Leptospira yasudae]MBW0435220.1 hypothetical protein [Leptospira yasudae]
MKSKKLKVFIITLFCVGLLFVVGIVIIIKFSPDHDPEISDSVKNEIRKNAQKFQIPPLRIQSMERRIHTVFKRETSPPENEVYTFRYLDDLYILKEGQTGEKELSLLGFFQFWQRLEHINLESTTRVLEEIGLPSLEILEKPNTTFSFKETYRTEFKSISTSSYAEYVSTCRTGGIMQASK